MIITGLARRKWLLAALAIPTFAICFAFWPFFLPPNNTPPLTDSFSFKIMSHNLFFRQDTNAMLKVIRQQQPDILLLQEIHPDLVSLPLDDLTDLYPDLYVDVVNQPEKAFVQAILSRYPITRIGAEFDQGRVQKVRIDTPAGPVIIWNTHLLPPFGRVSQWHYQQVDALVAEMATVKGPFIVAGDFNVTDQSTTYRAINQYLNEAHHNAGWGFGFTFPAPPHGIKDIPIKPGLIYRIDHIFYSNHFIAHNAQTGISSAGSDHLPVITVLSFVR